MSKKAVKTPKRKAKAAPTPSQLKETVISRSPQLAATQIIDPPRAMVVDSPKRSPRPGRKTPEQKPLVSAFGTPSLRGIAAKSGGVKTAPSMRLSFKTSQEPRWLAQPFNRFKLVILSLFLLAGVAYFTLSGPVSQYYGSTTQKMESWFDWRNWVQHVTHQKNQVPSDDQSTGTLLPPRDLSPVAEEAVTSPSASLPTETPAPHALDTATTMAAPAAVAAAAATKAAVEKSSPKVSKPAKVARVSKKKAATKPKVKSASAKGKGKNTNR